MKVIIKPHFSAKLQAEQYNPIEESGSMEMEIEVKNEEEAKAKYLELQKWIREQNIKSAVQGIKEVKRARAEAINQLDD